ncbi:hypothetical protein RSAG8_02334, partial [Rhizoctonia solani AG-8 WAC10335]
MFIWPKVIPRPTTGVQRDSGHSNLSYSLVSSSAVKTSSLIPPESTRACCAIMTVLVLCVHFRARVGNARSLSHSIPTRGILG